MSHLVHLVQQWEEFVLQNPKGNTFDFAGWLLGKDIPDKENVSERKKRNLRPPEFSGNDPSFNKYNGNQKTSMQAAYLISRMNQYISYHTKPMMKKHGLHSVDDFGYLQNILFFDGITKTKACELMLQEITTGIDIIKRLIRNGFVKEKVSKEDKRAKTLELTAKGQKVLQFMQQEFLQLPDTLGNMNEGDRKTLLEWLMQLDEHHNKYVKTIQKK